MKAIIEIDLANDTLAANDEGSHAELVYIFTIAARKLQELRADARRPACDRTGPGGRLWDTNGNHVGDVRLVQEER